MKRAKLDRKQSLRRTKFLAKQAKARSADRGGDAQYLEWIRSLHCCVCRALPPSHAHHATLTGRGKGQKSHDRETMPLCFRCHRCFHDGTGSFEYWTREQRRLWQELQVAECLMLFSYLGVASELPKAGGASGDGPVF